MDTDVLILMIISNVIAIIAGAISVSGGIVYVLKELNKSAETKNHLEELLHQSFPVNFLNTLYSMGQGLQQVGQFVSDVSDGEPNVDIPDPEEMLTPDEQLKKLQEEMGVAKK